MFKSVFLAKIGDKETHTIKAEKNSGFWTAKFKCEVRIWVDGAEIFHGNRMVIDYSLYKFQVGDKERHEVELKTGVWLGSGLYLIVDGKTRVDG
jgi:hypothetical protein